MRNRFTDPATGDIYDWTINHDAEEATGQSRAISRAANTGLTGAVKQQGDDGPLILNFSGTILDRSQLRAFWHWFALCRTQTIYFRDYDGQEYEVQIIDFQPKRARKLSFSGRDASMPYHNYTYTMQMEVYQVRAGDMADEGVTP